MLPENYSYYDIIKMKKNISDFRTHKPFRTTIFFWKYEFCNHGMIDK